MAVVLGLRLARLGAVEPLTWHLARAWLPVNLLCARSPARAPPAAWQNPPGPFSETRLRGVCGRCAEEGARCTAAMPGTSCQSMRLGCRPGAKHNQGCYTLPSRASQLASLDPPAILGRALHL